EDVGRRVRAPFFAHAPPVARCGSIRVNSRLSSCEVLLLVSNVFDGAPCARFLPVTPPGLQWVPRCAGKRCARWRWVRVESRCTRPDDAGTITECSHGK